MTAALKIRQIQDMPILIDNHHESILKSWHILQKVKYYLEMGVPNKIILELIEEMENGVKQ